MTRFIERQSECELAESRFTNLHPLVRIDSAALLQVDAEGLIDGPQGRRVLLQDAKTRQKISFPLPFVTLRLHSVSFTEVSGRETVATISCLATVRRWQQQGAHSQEKVTKKGKNL